MCGFQNDSISFLSSQSSSYLILSVHSVSFQNLYRYTPGFSFQIILDSGDSGANNIFPSARWRAYSSCAADGLAAFNKRQLHSIDSSSLASPISNGPPYFFSLNIHHTPPWKRHHIMRIQLRNIRTTYADSTNAQTPSAITTNPPSRSSTTRPSPRHAITASASAILRPL